MRVKYPRTAHLPWSPGATADDIYQGKLSSFEGKYVVVTEKMDGENTTLYRDYMHARSVDSRFHPSRNMCILPEPVLYVRKHFIRPETLLYF